MEEDMALCPRSPQLLAGRRPRPRRRCWPPRLDGGGSFPPAQTHALVFSHRPAARAAGTRSPLTVDASVGAPAAVTPRPRPVPPRPPLPPPPLPPAAPPTPHARRFGSSKADDPGPPCRVEASSAGGGLAVHSRSSLRPGGGGWWWWLRGRAARACRRWRLEACSSCPQNSDTPLHNTPTTQSTERHSSTPPRQSHQHPSSTAAHQRPPRPPNSN